MKKILFLFILYLASTSYSQKELTLNDSLLSSLNQQFELTKSDNANFTIKFNKDTIIILGYLSNPINPDRKNVIYKTSNAGKKWKVIEFIGDEYIYDYYHTKNGEVWIGGSGSFIHYSNDFGDTWTRKIQPFNSNERVSSIFMVDSLYGFTGGLSSGLALTYDNWNSSIQIKAPIKCRISKISILDSFIFIKQYFLN